MSGVFIRREETQTHTGRMWRWKKKLKYALQAKECQGLWENEALLFYAIQFVVPYDGRPRTRIQSNKSKQHKILSLWTKDWIIVSINVSWWINEDSMLKRHKKTCHLGRLHGGGVMVGAVKRGKVIGGRWFDELSLMPRIAVNSETRDKM